MRQLVFGILLTAWQPLFAEELQENFYPPRALGMGGAFTAIADDASALWSNPAGISRIRKARSRSKMHHATFPNLVGGGNKKGSSLYSKLQSAQGSDSKNQVSEVLQGSSLSDKPLWVTAAANPMVFFSTSQYTPPAVFGGYSSVKMNVVVDDAGDDDSSNDTALLQAVAENGVILGLSWANYSNRFNFGFNLRPASRYSYNDKVELTTLVSKSKLQDILKSESNSVQGVGVDAGLLFTFADFWFPTLGVSVLNLPTGCQVEYLNPFDQKRQTVCGTKFSGTIKNPEDTNLVNPTDTRVGLSITPRLSHRIGLRFAVDLHHLYFASGESNYGLSGIQPLRQTHAGVELFSGNPLGLTPFAIRAGYGEGSMSFGGTMRLGFITLEFASYGKDISTSTSPVEDNRIVGSLSGEF